MQICKSWVFYKIFGKMWILCKITGKVTKTRQGHLSPSWAVSVLFVYFVLECCRAYLGDWSPVPHLRTLLREAYWTGPGGTGASGVCMAAKPRQLWCGGRRAVGPAELVAGQHVVSAAGTFQGPGAAFCPSCHELLHAQEKPHSLLSGVLNLL